MRKKDQKRTRKQELTTTIGIVAGILVTAAGIAVVSSKFVGELDEGAQKVRQMKVRPELTVPAVSDMEIAFNTKNRIAQEHPRVTNLYDRAKAQAGAGLFKEAIATLKEAEVQYRKDLGGGKISSIDRLNLSVNRALSSECYEKLGDLKAALELQNEATALEPTKGNWERMEKLYIKLGRKAEAKAAGVRVRSYPSKNEMLEHLLNSLSR